MAENHKQDSNGHYLDSVGGIIATQEDLDLYEQGAATLSTLQAPRFLSANDPHERVYYICFDGTGNDVDKDPQHATNVAEIRNQLREAKAGDRRIAVEYAAGPGTQENWITKTWDGARGYTYEDRIIEQYKNLQDRVARWQEEDPDAKIRVVTIGFSRGAEQAAGFTRLLDEVGIQDRRDSTIEYKDGHWTSNPKHPPLVASGQTPQAVVLFDPVGTGVPLQFDRRLPPSVVSGIQLTSRDERRDQFKGTQIIEPGLSADGRFAGIVVPGAHSDVGGSYHRDGLALRSGNLAINYLNGLTETPHLSLRTERSDPDMHVIHRSEDHLALYTTRYMDKHQERGTVHEAPAPTCRQTEICMPQPADPALMAAQSWHPLHVQVAPQEPPPPPRQPVALSPDVVVRGAPADPNAGAEKSDPSPTQAAPSVSMRLDQPQHPGHALYQQAHQQLTDLYARQGIAPDAQQTGPLAAAIAVQAKAEGLQRIQQVELSPDRSQLHISDSHDTHAQRSTAQVGIVAALGQSMADSSQRWAQLPAAPGQTTPDAQRTATPAAPSLPRSGPASPDHPAHGDYETIRQVVAKDGRWDDTQSANIAAQLLNAHTADTLSKRLDSVMVGDVTQEGRTNVFAVHAPHGEKGPFFTTYVDSERAAQLPAEQSFGQLAAITQQQQQEAQQKAQEKAQQPPDHPGPRSM